MRIGTRRLFVKSLLATGTALGSLGALAMPAQAQQAAEEEAADDTGNDNIMVVTARRREESLIDVPLSVTAFSGAELERTGVQELVEIGQKSPNVTLEVSRGTNTTLTAFIRGIGQQDPVAGFEAGVGLYVDDVYYNRPQAAVLDVYDVERIEVLRGPQGTLYGRNTIGGAIKYVSRRLPDDFELKVRGSYGTYDQADLVVTASAPITPELRIGASGARLSRGGFGDNLTLGTENYNKDVWAARGSIEYDGAGVFVRLSGDYVYDESEARQGHRLIPGLQSGAPVLDDIYDTRAGLNVVDQEVESYGGALNIEIDLGSQFTLKSITAYREDSSTTPIDFDSLPAADVDVPAIYDNDQFSQELQLLYEGERLNGLVGFYYLDANASTVFDVLLATTGALVGLPGLNAQTFGDVDTETWSIFADFTYDITDQLSLSVGGRYTSDERNSRILRTTFIGGFSPFFGGTTSVPIAVTSNFTGGETFEDFNPRASLSWKPNKDHNFYFTFSQGFKGGGFDPRGQTSAAPDLDRDGTVSPDEIFEFIQFDPEVVDSYELGWKGALLNGDLVVSVAGFLQDYSNVQIPGSVGVDTNGDGINDTFTGVTTNAASADVNGIEVEGSWTMARDFAGGGSRFNLAWTFGYLDAEFNTFIDAFGNDVADQRVFQNTPEFTFSVTGDLGVPAFGGTIDLIPAVSFRSKASQFEVPNPFLDQPSFAIVDLSVTWRSDDDKYAIGVHGKNIFDEEYIVAGYNFVNIGPGPTFTPTLGREGTLTAFYGNPAQVFVTGQVKF